MKNEVARPKTIGKRGRIHTIDDKIQYFIVKDEIVHEQRIREMKTRKLIYLQKIKFDDGRSEYRFTYYMIGLKPGAKGRWVFGQSSLMIPPKALSVVLRKARERKWEGF